MTDAGLFGYYSHRRTVNLDGVINSYEYQLAIGRRRLAEFLRSCGVTHISDYEVPVTGRSSHRIDLPARLLDDSGYNLRVRSDAEVYASSPYRLNCVTRPGKTPVQFVIWQYDESGLHCNLERARHAD